MESVSSLVAALSQFPPAGRTRNGRATDAGAPALAFSGSSSRLWPGPGRGTRGDRRKRGTLRRQGIPSVLWLPRHPRPLGPCRSTLAARPSSLHAGASPSLCAPSFKPASLSYDRQRVQRVRASVTVPSRRPTTTYSEPGHIKCTRPTAQPASSAVLCAQTSAGGR